MEIWIYIGIVEKREFSSWNLKTLLSPLSNANPARAKEGGKTEQFQKSWSVL